jgi:hypothetical protein
MTGGRILCVVMFLLATAAGAQKPQKPRSAKKSARDTTRTAHDSVKVSRFFQSQQLITATLTTNIKRLKGDKVDKDGNAPWRDATLSYAGPNGAPVVMPIEVKVRGIWRLKNCEFPPVRLNFSSDVAKPTVFRGLDKPKLVNYCRDQDAYEDYILREFQLYRIYHLLTPASHDVRLLRLTYVDSASGKKLAERYAFIEEEPSSVATRVNARLLKITGAAPDDLAPFQSALVGVFQYMIGNTDFALGALHNAELLGLPNGEYWPVVYDFDFSGAVDAKYATVDPRLRNHTVRERLYRGYCVPLDTYPKVFELFNAKKGAIYALYSDSIGKRMQPNDVKETLSYFDDFYKTINNPSVAKASIAEACLGTKPK